MTHVAATDGLAAPDLTEYGGIKDGQRQALDRRLFMQLQAFTGCPDPAPLVAHLESGSLAGVLYADVNDPAGVGLLTFGEDPAVFVNAVRPMLASGPFASLTLRPEFTMLGRTYALGYEPDLEDTLIHRPERTVVNAAWPWAVWYPLRRSGAFSQLPQDERRAILKEHGTIGMSFGRADLAHDVRLACFGLDPNDNDFVVGLLGSRLHPLSAVVEAMRGTRQTSEFITRLGPFFVGRAIWQSPSGTAATA
jgi:chlorite dismutase